jgi:hypothetical protein
MPSAPREDGLFEVIDTLVDTTLDADPPHLQQHGTGWRVDEIASEGYLHDGPIALGNAHEAG